MSINVTSRCAREKRESTHFHIILNVCNNRVRFSLRTKTRFTNTHEKVEALGTSLMVFVSTTSAIFWVLVRKYTKMPRSKYDEKMQKFESSSKFWKSVMSQLIKLVFFHVQAPGQKYLERWGCEGRGEFYSVWKINKWAVWKKSDESIRLVTPSDSHSTDKM